MSMACYNGPDRQPLTIRNNGAFTQATGFTAVVNDNNDRPKSTKLEIEPVEHDASLPGDDDAGSRRLRDYIRVIFRQWTLVIEASGPIAVTAAAFALLAGVILLYSWLLKQ